MISPSLIKLLISKLNKDQDLYIVGGTVRDHLLGLEINDIDLTGNLTSEEFQNLFGGQITEKLGTVFTKILEEEIEYTPFRKEEDYDGRKPGKVTFGCSLEEDAGRRDFTINSLYYSLKEDKIIDLFNGQEDLKNKKLKSLPPPEERLSEDNLRILRAARFVCKYDLSLDSETEYEIKKLKHSLLSLSGFRIRQELFKGLQYPSYLPLLDRLGLLEVLFPIVENMRNLEQNTPHHKYDVLTHCFKSLEAAYNKFPNEESIFYLTVFLHDVGKPLQFLKQRYFEPGTEDFKEARKLFNHSKVGYNQIKNSLDKINFTNKEKEYIKFQIKFHQTEFLYERFTRTKKSLRRFLIKHELDVNSTRFPLFLDLLKLAFSDRMGTGTRTLDEVEEWYKEIHTLLEEVLEEENCFGRKDLEINGHDLINLGFKGVQIKTILEEILNKVISEEVENKKDKLLNYVTKNHQS